jgi:hypothetical protein
MPSLFDSHEEFSEWFSKDIENAAGGGGGQLKPEQLRRLHMILKPFMLRRVKKHVQKELGDKVGHRSQRLWVTTEHCPSRLRSTSWSTCPSASVRSTKRYVNGFLSRTSSRKPTTSPTAREQRIS